MCLCVSVVEVNNLLAIFFGFQKNFSKTIFALCLGNRFTLTEGGLNDSQGLNFMGS